MGGNLEFRFQVFPVRPRRLGALQQSQDDRGAAEGGRQHQQLAAHPGEMHHGPAVQPGRPVKSDWIKPLGAPESP